MGFRKSIYTTKLWKILQLILHLCHASCISTVVWFWFSTSCSQTGAHSKTGTFFVASTQLPICNHLQRPEESLCHYCWEVPRRLAQSHRLKLDSCPSSLHPSERQNLGQELREFTGFASCSSLRDSAPGYKIKQQQKFQSSENILSAEMTENRCLKFSFLWYLVKS